MIKIQKKLPLTFRVGVIFGLILCLGLLAPWLVLARGGGGDRFPVSPSPGPSGGGGDADGIVYLIFYVLFSRLPWPIKIIAIVVIIAVAGGMSRRKIKARQSAGGASGSAPSGGLGYPGAHTSYGTAVAAGSTGLAAQLAELKKRDPGFSQQRFEDMASTAFFKVQEAWSKKDMAIARAFVSPALLQRFSTQIDEFKRLNRTNHMEQLTIGSLDMVEAAHDGGYDYITVRINAAAVDYTVDDKSGGIVSGSKQISAFTEYWTFLRSDAIRTEADKELIVSTHCPNCGAPISLNAVGKCDYCGSEVTSGRFSWVLSEITQASAWRPRAQAVRPAQISPLAGQRYVLGLVQCPNCGANVQDVAGITTERCWRCGGTVPTAQ